MAKNNHERSELRQDKALMKSPDGTPGNHMSDRAKSNDKFYKEMFAADRTMKSSETLGSDFTKDRENLKPKHKGKAQL